MREEIIKGQIIDIEDSREGGCVVIKCRLREHYYQVRRFSIEPFEGVIPLKSNAYLEIRIKTEPGKVTTEFIHLPGDHRKDFEVPGVFHGFENSPFMVQPDINQRG